jgi:hypothetical protein
MPFEIVGNRTGSIWMDWSQINSFSCLSGNAQRVMVVVLPISFIDFVGLKFTIIANRIL